jgi:hypothetical protein
MPNTWIIGPLPGDDFTTISAAVLASSDSDIGLIRSGTYAEAIPNGGLDGIRLLAHPDNTAPVIIDGGGVRSSAVDFLWGWELGGTTAYPMEFIDHTSAIFGVLRGVFPNGSDYYIHDIKIHSGWGRGANYANDDSVFERVWADGGSEYGLSGGRLDNCKVTNPGAGSWRNMEGDIVRHCLVYGTQAGQKGIVAGSQCYNSVVAGTGAVGIEARSTVRHEWNIVAGTFTTDIGGGTPVGSQHPTEQVFASVNDLNLADPGAGDYTPADETSPLVAGGMYRGVVSDFGGNEWGVTPALTKAVDLDGTDEWVSVPASVAAEIASGTKFSLSFWVKSTTPAGSEYVSRVSSADAVRLSLRTNSGSDGLDAIIQTGATKLLNTPSLPEDGYWHLLVVTVDESTREAKIYMDGELGDTETLDAALLATDPTDKYVIGKDLDGGPANSRYYDGKIMGVGFWSDVLTAGEVSELFGDGAPESVEGHSAAGDLVAYYPLGEGDTHPTATDTHGSHDATYQNTEAADIGDVDLRGAVNVGPYADPKVLVTDAPLEGDTNPAGGMSPYGGVEGGAPTVLRIEALSLTKVRVHFSTPMMLDGDLVDPARYVLASVQPGGGAPEVTAVEVPGLSPTYVDLTVSGLRPGRRYLATIE